MIQPTTAPATRIPVSGRSRPRRVLSPKVTFASWQYAVVGVLIAALGLRVIEFFPFLALIRPIVLLLGGAWAAFVVATGGQSLVAPFEHEVTKYLLAFAAWLVLTTPFSIWVGGSLGVVKAFAIVLAGLWVILATPRSLVSADRLQLAFVLASATFGALHLLMGREQVGGRYAASIGLDVNDTALVLAACLPLVVGLALRSVGLYRLLLWSASALITVAAMRTGSRGGGLALLAGMAVLFGGMSWRRNVQLLLIAVPLALVAWTTAPDSFRSRMSSLFAGEQDYNQTDADGRVAIWKRGLRYGLDNPVSGVGPGAFVTQDGIGKAELGLRGKWSTAHNTYLQAFAELGFPGLALFLGCVGVGISSSLRVYKGSPTSAALRRPEYLASIVAFLVGISFLSFLYYPMTWVLIAGLSVMAAGTRSARTIPTPGPVTSGRVVAMQRRWAKHTWVSGLRSNAASNREAC